MMPLVQAARSEPLESDLPCTTNEYGVDALRL